MREIIENNCIDTEYVTQFAVRKPSVCFVTSEAIGASKRPRRSIPTSESSESLLVLPRVDPGDDLLELPLGLARGEVGHVVVLRGGGHEPLRLDVDAGPDVVL